MTKNSRRKYDPDFKRNAVLLCIEQGRSVAEVADNLGINRDLLYHWRSKYNKANGLLAFPGKALNQNKIVHFNHHSTVYQLPISQFHLSAKSCFLSFSWPPVLKMHYSFCRKKGLSGFLSCVTKSQNSHIKRESGLQKKK